MKRKETGGLGEKLAREYIEKRGYVVIETNYRCRFGEIDIVARQGNAMVFIEVRAKHGNAFGTPEESVTLTKRRHLIATAAEYYQTHQNLPEDYRIDFVAVELGAGNRPVRIELIENAVAES